MVYKERTNLFYWHLKRWASPKSWKIWLIKGRRGCGKHHHPSHEIFTFTKTWHRPTVSFSPCPSHVTACQCQPCWRGVMLQYIISVVFPYLKHIFLIFFSFSAWASRKTTNVKTLNHAYILIMIDSLKDSQFGLLWLSLMCSRSTLGLFLLTYKSLCWFFCTIYVFKNAVIT